MTAGGASAASHVRRLTTAARPCGARATFAATHVADCAVIKIHVRRNAINTILLHSQPPKRLDGIHENCSLYGAASRDLLAIFGAADKVSNPGGSYSPDSLYNISIHSRPIRRLTPQPTDRGRADCPSMKGGGTEKDFIGFAVLSTTRFPLKGEVSNHKGIFDELPL